MAASNPQGEMQFWDNGFPMQGVKLSSNDAGEMQFWDNGFPMQFQFPPSGGSNIKTWNGLVNALVKLVNGLVRGSVKSRNGLQ